MSRSFHRSWLIGLVVGLAGSVHGRGARAEDKAMLDRIISNVASNETLYENIEIICSTTMLAGENRIPMNASMLLKKQHGVSRTVLQEGLFYYKCDDRGTTADGAPQDLSALWGYDGKTTRLVEQNAYANIYHGEKHESTCVLRPHLFLLMRGIRVFVPLSVFLRADEALKSHQLAG
ncbi:MAG TPA: hypothetical protein VGO93_20635, partial [Candidatus Xenobia bacterium]